MPQTEEEASTSTLAQLLVQDLSFVVKPHQHLMITGSNGVGKTAIARVLAGLWAPRNVTTASVHTPASVTAAAAAGDDDDDIKNGCVFVVPQRAYMVSGSLLDQVIYPHTYEMFVKAGGAGGGVGGDFGQGFFEVFAREGRRVDDEEGMEGCVEWW